MSKSPFSQFSPVESQADKGLYRRRFTTYSEQLILLVIFVIFGRDQNPASEDLTMTICFFPIERFSNMICGVAGITSDANILINYVQTAAQQYLYTYNEDMPCEQLVQKLCDLKQGYTQYGGK